MQAILFRLRSIFEIIALPAFVFLVVHLSGHGVMAFLEGEHHHHHGHEKTIHDEAHHHDEGEGEAAHEHEEDHDHEAEEADHPASEHEHKEHTATPEHDHSPLEEALESFFTVEVLSGVLLLILFTWLWHQPILKKLSPCAHDHCEQGKEMWPHILATLALCLHFFPEAGVRHVLLQQMLEGHMLSVAGIIGFAAHFLVDVIVALLLSLYWREPYKILLSFGAIAGCWVLALFTSDYIIEHIPVQAEGVLFLVSAFLLCMFVHKPHFRKGKPSCKHHHMH